MALNLINTSQPGQDEKAIDEDMDTVQMRGDHDGMGEGNLTHLQDEDFKEAGSSSAPTKDSDPEDGNQFDSDELLDEPEEKEGDKVDVGVPQVPTGAVNKEIVQVGMGVKKPRLSHLCKIVYQAYFYDH